MSNIGVGALGGVVLIDPATGQPYKATGGGGGGIDVHNDLTSIQGGSTTERYHLTSAQHTAVTNLGVDLAGKRDVETGANVVYTNDGSGDPATLPVTASATNGAVVQRGAAGEITLPNVDPPNATSAATKQYVDTKAVVVAGPGVTVSNRVVVVDTLDDYTGGQAGDLVVVLTVE